MWFHFSGFTATPGKLYSVSALNIPPPNIGGDYDSEPEQFNTPDCTDERMRLYEYCVAMGSTWDPNITTVYRGNSVDITFTSSRHSQRYILYLYSCGPPPINLHNCDLVNNTDFTTDKPRITQTLNASQECEYLLIQIVPHFHECELNCVRVNAKVNCSQPAPSYNAGVLIAMTVAGISLCGIFILYKISWCGRNTGTSTQTPFTVLIVYPPGSSVLQKTVLIFAEFLQSHSRCKVIIDIWQRQRIAEIGPVRWLAIQKESADKIIAVCSDSTSRQWPGSSLEVRDQTVPASTEDFFILALNMFSSDLRQDLCKYMVVYFGEIAKGKSRHVALRACRSYSLMKDIEKFYHSLHNIPPNNSCCIRPASSMGPTYTTDTSKKLREAIRELKEWEELQLSSTTQDLR
ncbi:interleukin-17 receptor B [Amia ocellicauda]|uniref:interleukin-17 receptor B n=1 Tax=Amia ocellicauda TaxID=2972642 RepID=UPI003464A2CB